jgi:Fur family ferric uptake transcriptional regulator
MMRTPNSDKPRKSACSRPSPEIKKSSFSKKEILEKLDRYLRDQGLKQSAIRIEIVEAIVGMRGHFSVAELTDKIHNSSPQIGAATIYRNIPTLIDAGILQETLKTDNGQAFYELADDDHHDHIVCVDCGRIFEFHEKTIEKEQERITKQMQFETQAHRHVIYASCTYKK